MKNTVNKLMIDLKLKGFQSQLTDKNIRWENKSFRIRPDEAFYFKNKIVLFEFEKQKRPVESISKYWWLYHKTDWMKLNVNLELHLYLIRHDINPIRLESMDILGGELMKQFPRFRYFNHGNLIIT